MMGDVTITAGVATARCISMLTDNPELRRATYYLGPRDVVKATRQHRHDARMQHETFLVTVGRPNYRERAFIKDMKRAGVPFPCRKLQLTFWPLPRKGKR